MVVYQKINYKNRPIRSLDSLAKTLDISEARLSTICADSARFYDFFDKVVKNKNRELCVPKPELMQLQRKIISRIFCHLYFPPYLFGGVKADHSADFVSNASAHKGAHVAVAIDIKNFFPSIKESLVEGAFRSLFNFSDDVARALTKLVCVKGFVPQGAATSSYIANIILYEKEYELVRYLTPRKLTYTRLIDDITISSTAPVAQKEISAVTTRVIGMLKFYDLEFHDKKYKVYTRSNPLELMHITGLWINRGAPRLEKSTRQQVETDVISLKKKIEGNLEFTYSATFHSTHASLSGKVALLNRLGHKEAIRLREMLKSMPPTFDEFQTSKLKRVVVQFCDKPIDKTKLGYLKKFYKLQYSVSILRNNNKGLAKFLQRKLNTVRPTKTFKELNG